MGSLGNTYENEILDHLFSAASFTPDTTLWIGLSTADPTDDASGNAEPSTGSYARVSVTNNATNWPAASGGAKANGTAFTFPESTAAWSGGSNLTHFAIWNHATNSAEANLVAHGTLDTARAVAAAGVTLSFAIGDLDITLD